MVLDLAALRDVRVDPAARTVRVGGPTFRPVELTAEVFAGYREFLPAAPLPHADMDEGQERVRARYRADYERLARVQAVYDPDNVFRVNQNFQPAAG